MLPTTSTRQEQQQQHLRRGFTLSKPKQLVDNCASSYDYSSSSSSSLPSSVDSSPSRSYGSSNIMSSASDDEAAAAAGAVVNFIDRGGLSNYDTDTLMLSPEEAAAGAGATIDVDGFCYANYRIEQYAQGVLDFSSQYGSDYSISYTAPNITGKPSKYSEYGDFPETFAMRTYGDWWNKAPSRAHEIQPQNLQKIPVHDFIVVYFEDYIIPEEIHIFETFNPGAVVRIWAYTITKTWFCMWEAKDLSRPSIAPHRARRFSPPLKKLQMPTKTIRLEFNHTPVNYFTEIDAVLLCGRNVSIENMQRIFSLNKQQRNSSIVRKLQNMQFRPSFKDNYESCLQDFFMHDLSKFVSVLTTTANKNQVSSGLNMNTAKCLHDMPFEIILKIFGYLDLISLFRVSQTSHYFYDVATHPLLYSELNLKPYWHLASTDLLCTLAKRATILKKLDLSWCGLNNSISPTEFKKFIQQRGDSLTHLRLNSCKFLNASCIETLGIVCDNLKELSLRNCSTDPPLINLSCSLANLKNLERLDLFETVIESDLLMTMLESNRKMKHLNLAFCAVAVNMDEVAQHIGNYNQQLVSLDMWKSHFLSAVGLQALSKCHDLEEVDFGWCLREASLGESLTQLLKNCPKLKKLFLTAVRGLTDRDVANIASLCKNLEQLDLMGVTGIAKERYHDILVNCRNLQLLDLSFCDLDENEISLWARTFKVNIISNVPINFITNR